MSHIDLQDRRRRAARLRLAELIALRRATKRTVREPLPVVLPVDRKRLA